MKKNIIPFFALLALLTTACNDEYSDQFNLKNEITDVKDAAFTLEAADYNAIASNKSNQELALSKDPEGNTGVDALNAVGKKGYFTVDAPAEEYIPAFLLAKFPYADLGSKYKVTYKQYQAPSAYLGDFSNIKSYNLTDEDYKTVWGDKVKASYLSPATLGEIGSILKTNLTDAAKGDVAVVNYAYSQTEPSIGGGGIEEPDEPASPYTPLSDLAGKSEGSYLCKGEIVAASAKSLLISDGTDIVRIYRGYLSSFSVGDEVVVEGDVEFKQELTRFRSKAVVSYLSRKASFAYPTPKQIDAAYFATYVTAPKVEFVTYAGKLTQSGTNYNIEIDSETIQPGITDALYIDPALVGQDVVVTGYLTGVSGSSTKYPNTFATSIVAKDATPEYTSAGALQYAAAGNYSACGVVSAVYTKGFMLSDASGHILVYKNKVPTEVVGQIVSVKGATSARNGAMQFSNVEVEVLKNVEAGTPTIPESMVPQALTLAEFEALATTPRVAYVSIEGTLSIEDSGNGFNYYNLAIEGSENTISISYVDDKKFDQTLNGKKVKVTGFILDFNKGRVAMMYSKAEEVGAATTRALTRAGVQPTATALYRYDGTNWKPYKADDVNVTAFSVADYQALGADVISAPELVLPIYAAGNYPYAQEGDKVAVVYAYKAGEYGIDELVKTAAGWILTPDYIEQATTFTLEVNENGARTYTAKINVWIEDSLLGSTGGFEVQDISLNGLTYVWSNTSGYGWKGSAFANSTNNAAESWLISPAFDFRKATAPVLCFDEAFNFAEGKANEHALVKISTDYTGGDVTKATWETLELGERATGNNWNFISIKNVDLSAYVGNMVHVAFIYKSTTEAAPTWEFKNIKIAEKDAK